MKRRVGALLMALVLVMTGFAAYAEEGQPAELAVEDSVEDASVPEEEPVEGEDAAYFEEEPAAAAEEPAEVAEPEAASEIPQSAEAEPEAQITEPEETQGESAAELEMAEEAAETEESEEDIETFTALSGNLSVTVEAPKGALPDGVQLDMQLVDADSEEYEEVQSYVQEGGEEASNLEIADIYFTLDGEKVDPSEAVTVKLGLAGFTDADRSSLQAWDYTDGIQGTLNAETQEVEFITANLQTFAATWEDGKGAAIATYSVFPSDEEEESNSELSIKIIETSSPEDGEAYQKGEELNYYIEVENIGEVDLYNIVVKDYLSARSWEINSLSANGGVYTTQEDEISYMITTLDAENGSVNIEAEAFYSNVPQNSELRTYNYSDEPLVYCTKSISCRPRGQKENLNPDVSVIVTVTSTPKDGVAYREGEELTYYVTVENSGNVDLVDIVVIDNLSRENWEIDSLPWEGYPYSTEDDPKSYVITEKDAKAGSVSINGRVKADYASNESGHGKTLTWKSDGNIYEEEILTHQIEELTVTIKVDDDHAYKEGDTIEYTVIVENTGNFTVSDIQVTNSPVDKSSEGSWTIKSLEPGELGGPGGSEEKIITYTVSKDDTLTDEYNDTPSIIFTAKAEGQATLADGSKSEVKAEDEQKIDIASVPQKFVDTDQDKKDEERDYNDNGKEVESGDTLVYLITYENTDTQTKTVTIKDKLENGLKFDKASKGGTLNDKNEVTWTFEAAPLEAGYVTLTTKVEKDVESNVKNSASVKVGDNEALPTNTVENPIKDKDPDGPWKSVNAGDGKQVSVGQNLEYTISFYNHHATSQTVTIRDELGEGLTYVSATKDGEFKSGTITWEMELKPFSTGEVTFIAKVNGENLTSELTGEEEKEEVDVKEDDDDGENGDGEQVEVDDTITYSYETVTYGEVENTAYVKIGDDEEKATNSVTNYIYSKSDSPGYGSGSGSDGEGSSKNTAVNTADDTPVAPMAALFGAALIVLDADIIYRRRRTQR